MREEVEIHVFSYSAGEIAVRVLTIPTWNGFMERRDFKKNTDLDE